MITLMAEDEICKVTVTLMKPHKMIKRTMESIASKRQRQISERRVMVVHRQQTAGEGSCKGGMEVKNRCYQFKL